MPVASPPRPFDPVDSVVAWRGPQLVDKMAWTHQLTAEETEDLLDAVGRARALGRPLKDIRKEDVPLSGALARATANWAEALDDGLGFVLVRGFPVDRLDEEGVQLGYWVLGCYLGTPVPQNGHGDVIGQVRDEGDDPNKIGTRLYRTTAAQDFHTDGADIIGLLCVRPAKSGGLSRIVSSVSVFNEVLRRRPDLAPFLFEDFYWDREADVQPGESPVFRFPICKYENGRLRMFYIGWYIRNAQRFPEVPPLTPQQQDVLDLVEEIANDPAFYLDMDFRPGDIQLLKNAVILHARTAYDDWEDPTRKRWLLRLWLTAPQFKDGDEILRQGVQPLSSSGTDHA